jgi:hypothetical protein
MKSLSEYQKTSIEKLKSENGYKAVLMYVNAKTDKRLVKLAKEYGCSKREVLNFVEMG